MAFSLLFLPALVFIQSLLIFGLSLITATLNVFYQDVQYAMNVAVMGLFYLTPVFYQADAVGDKYRLLYAVNPLSVLVESYRAIFFQGMAPQWNLFLLAALISTIVLGLGWLIYRRLLSTMYDFL